MSAEAGEILRAEVAVLFARSAERMGIARRHPVDGIAIPDPDLVRGLAQLGVTTLAVPEAAGGAGGHLTELFGVLTEAGNALLAPELLVTSGWAIPAVLAAATSPTAAATHLAPVLAGDRSWSAAWPGVLAGSEGLTAVSGGVSGSADVVLGGTADDIVVVLPLTGGRARVVVAAPVGPRTTLDVLDPTRPMARIDFRDAPGTLVGELDAAATTRLRAVWLTALAADSVGGMRRCLDAAVSYACQRHAFGRPIGSFQAVKHRCADMYVAAETASAALAGAATLLDEDRADRADRAAALELALVVAAHTAATFPAVAGSSQLVFGGLGFTYECAAHFVVRRARGNAVLLGAAATLQAELAELVEVA